MNSINHPAAISDKHRARYGDIWADMDFEMKQVSEKVFHDNPTTVPIGFLIVAGRRIEMTLNDLNVMQMNMETIISEAYAAPTTPREVRIKSTYVHLNITEINRLYETINDAVTTINRKYQLGLYL
jgi:hypothetical protein